MHLLISQLRLKYVRLCLHYDLSITAKICTFYTSVPLRRNMSARISLHGQRRLNCVDTLRIVKFVGFIMEHDWCYGFFFNQYYAKHKQIHLGNGRLCISSYNTEQYVKVNESRSLVLQLTFWVSEIKEQKFILLKIDFILRFYFSKRRTINVITIT